MRTAARVDEKVHALVSKIRSVSTLSLEMSSPKSAPASTPADADANLQELLGEAEKDSKPQEIDIDTVQERLENVLSKQSLAEDAFIQQHMNAQMYIPMIVLARHQSLQILGDEAAVLPAMRIAAERSVKLGLDDDGTMVRPLLKARRNTLILHGLQDGFPEDELKALFEGSPEADAFNSLKPDVNNTAFVSFKSDEAAQNAALWLRSQQFQGAAISCSVKSEHFVRSFFPASGTPGFSHSTPPANMMGNQWGYSNWDPNMVGWDPNMSGWMPDGGKGWDGKGDGGKGKSPKGHDKGKGKAKGRQRGSLGGSFSQDSQMETNSDFSSPQLPPSHMGLDSEPFQEGLPEPGYTHEYRKYSRQYIIEVCNSMDDRVKPESYVKKEKEEVLLFRATPCKEWAPLPTPMTAFSANFFDNDRRGSMDTNDGESEKGGKGGKGRRGSEKGGKGRGGEGDGSAKGSRSESHDYEEADWAHGDSSWWNSRSSWGEGNKSWEYKQGDGGYEGKQWVKKEDKAEQDADDNTGPRKMSWAEKVKGVDSSDRPQKWVAKVKAGEENKGKEKDEAAPVANSNPAAAASNDSSLATPAAAEESADASASKPLSWADKARQAATK